MPRAHLTARAAQTALRRNTTMTALEQPRRNETLETPRTPVTYAARKDPLRIHTRKRILSVVGTRMKLCARKTWPAATTAEIPLQTGPSRRPSHSHTQTGCHPATKSAGALQGTLSRQNTTLKGVDVQTQVATRPTLVRKAEMDATTTPMQHATPARHRRASASPTPPRHAVKPAETLPTTASAT